jgi:hypothetical protein
MLVPVGRISYGRVGRAVPIAASFKYRPQFRGMPLSIPVITSVSSHISMENGNGKAQLPR